MSSILRHAPASCQTLARPGTCLLTIIALVLTGCGKDGVPSAAVAPPPVPVHVVKVEPRNVPIRFDVPGQVEGSKEVEVRARVAGLLEKQFYKEGDAVKEGAPLFQIDRAPFQVALAQAKGQFAQATAQVEQTRREEARLKPLADERAISRKEFDDATSAQQLAEAALQQATAAVRQAELNLSYTVVNAPVAGITGRAEHSDRNAHHHRRREQPADDDQHTVADLGALQPRGIRSRQDSWRPGGARQSARSASGARRWNAISRQGPAQFRGDRDRCQAGDAAVARGVRQHA